MRKIILLATGLLLLTNIVVLAGVAYNRSGDANASLLLTERELSPVNNYSARDENSGTALTIEWQTLNRHRDGSVSALYSGQPIWLDGKKLQTLGVDAGAQNRNQGWNRYRSLSLEVVYVLEYDGPAYHKALQLAQQNVDNARAELTTSPDSEKLDQQLIEANRDLQQLRHETSRLFVIDAGLDVDRLMQKYNNPQQYMMMRGELIVYPYQNETTAYVRKLFISSIHVPLPFSAQLANIDDSRRSRNDDIKKPFMPRYEVRLKLGKRLEPWIESVSLL